MTISIILAAGEGTRMKSKTSKVLHKICNKPILEYVIESSKNADINKHIVVVGENKDAILEEFDDSDIIFKEQPIGEEYPYGTGYAVMQTIDEIEDDNKVLILYGDTPLITEETVSNLIKYHDDNNLKATVLTAVIDDPTGYGRIIREEDGSVLRIVEEKDATEEEKKKNEINSGIYVFDGKLLKNALSEIDDDNAQNEYYITDVIGILKNEGHDVGAYMLENPEEIHGVNSRSQLAFCEKVMRERINNYHMENGVTIIDPMNTYIDDNVIIGQDTIIYPGVMIESGSKIGECCTIRQNTRIFNSEIANNVEIEESVIEQSFIDEGSDIGPFTHIRPNSKIGKNVGLGNFVEVKNSTLGEGTKAGHLAYIGDSDLGENINVGCGVIFVNYDGINKHRSTVGDGVFLGCNSNIVSPVNIGDRAFIAAGSTITDDVEGRDLAIARSRQTNKKNWVKF